LQARLAVDTFDNQIRPPIQVYITVGKLHILKYGRRKDDGKKRSRGAAFNQKIREIIILQISTDPLQVSASSL